MDLNASEISRLLDLELNSVERETLVIPPVKLDCSLSQIRVIVDDPVTGKTLSREMVAPTTDDPTANRIVALAVAELFMSSWLELLLPPERRVVQSNVPPQTVTRITQVAQSAVEPKPIRWELGLEAALRMHNLGAAYLGYRPGLFAAWLLRDKYRLLLAAGLEYIRVPRATGDVAARSTSLGTGAGLRLKQTRHIHWDADVVLSIVSVRANGESNANAVIERSATGLGLDAALKAGPTLRFGALLTQLQLQSGLMLPRFTARVQGDAPVELGGLWVGLGVALGLSEGTP